MGAATATEAAINTTLHPTSTSAEDSILQAPSAGLAVHFFFTQARDTSYVIVPTLVVPASFADASRRAAIAFIGFCLCRECARARVCVGYRSLCSLREVANSRVRSLSVPKTTHARTRRFHPRELL